MFSIKEIRKFWLKLWLDFLEKNKCQFLKELIVGWLENRDKMVSMLSQIKINLSFP